jgi:hypothetical protein
MTRTFSLSVDSEKLRLPGRRQQQRDRSIVPNVSLSIARFDVRNHCSLSSGVLKKVAEIRLLITAPR